ncbi:hypothetical protein IWW36_004135 [Coemansia brasiliensis]|uniref:Uncharacterized protein n=1 Tax=Coemansia brasiliensis TaxID=2650707 RepID=A0A9W8I6H5_9FUNG|nr:hypothetical protein IWW36_004135 [Coemansia brasiliensis]
MLCCAAISSNGNKVKQEVDDILLNKTGEGYSNHLVELTLYVEEFNGDSKDEANGDAAESSQSIQDSMTSVAEEALSSAAQEGSGVGAQEGGECTSGLMQCSGSGYQVCVNGKWSPEYQCGVGTTCKGTEGHIFCDFAE